MNKRYVNTCIRSFLYLWPHLKAENVALLKKFVTSRHSFVHQNHVDLFIHIYCLDISNTLTGINYRRMLDLICKLVVDYIEGKLIKREYKAGKNSEWNKI